MKLIIAGHRLLSDYSLVEEYADHVTGVTEVVSGTCRGADLLGERWARERGIPVRRFPADWGAYHGAAGPIRNRQMAEYGDMLLAFLAPESRGTQSMINEAKKANLPIVIIELEYR